MWNVIVWFTKRRWQLKRWTRGYTRDDRLRLYYNMMDTNMGGCFDSSTIQIDLQNCLKLTSRDFA